MLLVENQHKFKVDNAEGDRLDRYLSVCLGRSRAFVKYQIEKGAVQVNRLPVIKPAHWLHPLDEVEMAFREEERRLDLVPIARPLDILYEDADLVVINKPQGWVVHPASGHKGETVVHFLLHFFQNDSQFASLSPVRPGIVHRLDKGTSGCLIVARHRRSLEALSEQFKARKVEKQYEAIAWGEMKKQGTMNSSISRHSGDRKKMTGRGGIGREALTTWSVAEDLGQFSLVDLYPKTGRTHQLRVHLSESGHAIVGDRVYSRRSNPANLPADVKTVIRELEFPCLHAAHISFDQPLTGQRIKVTAPRPAQFETILSLVRRTKT